MLGIEVFVWIMLFVILGMIGSWVIRIKEYVKELELNLLMLSRKMEINDRVEELLRENKEWKEKNKDLEELNEKFGSMVVEYRYLRGRE